jgi:hypothetical protein
MKSTRALFFLLLVAALWITTAPLLMAQTGSTGALAGTVTDPSGAVVSGATVIAMNVDTGQERSVTTSANGAYKFALLPPGTYSVKFSASGFKTVEVPSIKVNVTETAVLNHSLEVGAQTQQVTVEATAVTIQTENATNGGLVSSREVTTLPLVSRNYTQILSLSPGIVSNVTSASAVGNGTDFASANGSKANQNNYSMDGSSVVNYVSGTAGQLGSFPGVAIPNPDTIQEFKVQTSQYDAASGRNPGANVNVVTKGGTNEFHGTVWEFNRNNMFNANDFFYKRSELEGTDVNGNPLKNKPQTLKQNTFGFTFGGPIKKDKIFFFGSYQGIRQVNGMGTTGFASGYAPNTYLFPWNAVNPDGSLICSDLRCTDNISAYRAYLGSVFGGQVGSAGIPQPPPNPATPVPVAADGSNITNTAIALLQAKGTVKGGYNQGFYFPSGPPNCSDTKLYIPGNPGSGCLVAISQPFYAREDQYMINTDYVLSSKHTLSEKYMYQTDPEFQPLNCFIYAGDCNPGAPVNAHYYNHVGLLKLTSVLTNNFVNEARFSFHRDVEDNADPTQVLACNTSSTAYVIPMVNQGLACGSAVTPPYDAILNRFPETNLVPILDVGTGSGTGAWSQGGNFAMISSNFDNTFQYADQISWTHGKHALRAGFEAERVQHNGTIPASERGELLIGSTADFLVSSAGPPGTNPLDPSYDDGTPHNVGGVGFGFGLKGWLTHYNRVNSFNWYVQDDIKVNAKLTVNVGVRWEWNGYPNDVSGRFANVWASEAAKVNTGSWFLAHPEGTLVGFVVPSNYDPTPGLTAPSGASGVVVNSNQTLVPGTPWHNFAPRLGAAWQPLGDKLVVRAGYGIFYDRVYGNLLIDNQLNLPPYSGAGFGTFPGTQQASLHNPWIAGAGPLVWTPRTIVPAAFPFSGFTTSGLGYTSDSPQMADHTPLIYEYNLDVQYEFAKGWVADVGYVGSHGTHLYNWSQNINVGHLVQGAPNSPTAASGEQNTHMIASSLPFNDAANLTPVTTEVNTCFYCFPFLNANADVRSSYLGFSPGGVASTNTLGDMSYNSLQAQLRHQFGHGLFLQVAYTWSQEFTNVNAAQAGGFLSPGGSVVYGQSVSNDPLDLRQQYGRAAFNRPQRAVITYSYDLPYKNMQGISGKVLGGWAISGVTTVQNGQPFTVTDGAGNTIYGAGTSRAALANPINCSAVTGNCLSGTPIATSGSNKCRLGVSMPGCSTTQGWMDPNAFIRMCTVSGYTGALSTSCDASVALPASSPYCIGGIPNPFGPGDPTAPCGSATAPFLAAGTGYGNSRIGSVWGPGQFNWDMAILKNTKIWEHGTLQFRAEFFNIWNHAQFNPPGNDVNNPTTFGKITSTSNTPRVIQFGLKYLF